MDGESHTETVLRLRCRCGQRVRVRNARPGTIVRCPKCQKAIRISATALRVAHEAEAAVMAAAEPQSADAGSGDGDADLDLLVRTIRTETGDLDQPTPADQAEGPMDEARRASFLPDLLSTFVLAGRPSNALNLLATSVGCTLPVILLSLIPFAGFLIWPIVLIINATVVLYVVQFLWGTLGRTAAGDDDIPLIDPDWDWWEDGLLPLLYLVAISVACFAPGMVVHIYASDVPNSGLWAMVALAIGALVWPVAVLAVALGGSLVCLRPDWLVRSLVGIGPVYIVPWLLVVLTVVGGYGLLASVNRMGEVPFVGEILFTVASALLGLYLGYVIFRILGLLYRHFHARLPFDFG